MLFSNFGVIGAYNDDPDDGILHFQEFNNHIVLISFGGVYIVPTSVPLQINMEMFLGAQNLFTKAWTYSPVVLSRVANVGEQIKIIYTPLINPFDKIIENVYVYS